MPNQKIRVSVHPDWTTIEVQNGASREYTIHGQPHTALPAVLASLHPADVAPVRALVRSILDLTADVAAAAAEADAIITTAVAVRK